MISIRLTAVPQTLDSSRERLIASHHGAAVAERAEVLRRIKAEGPRDTDRADGAAGCRREMRLAAVFDERQVVSRRDPLDRGHVCRLAVEMDGHDRARTRADGAFDLLGVAREPRRIDVGEHTGRAPAIITASALYAADSGVVITSSPSPMPSARK